MQPEPTDPPKPPEHSFFWWCAVCHRAVPFGDSELAQFGRDGWPVCCGHTVFCASVKDPPDSR